MTISDIVDVASELTRGWMDIWFFFVFVITALLAAVISLKKSLTENYAALLMAGFTIFAIMHGVTIVRHYATFSIVLNLLTPFGHQGRAANRLVESMAPVTAWLVIPLYILFVLLTLLAIARRRDWALAAPKGCPAAPPAGCRSD